MILLDTMPTSQLITVVVMLIAGTIVAYWVGYSNAKELFKDHYKKGQVDALNGIQKFKLIEFKNGTRSYVKESELKHLKEHTVIK